MPRQYIKYLQISAEWRPVGWLVLILIAIGFVFGRKPANRKPLLLVRSLEVHDWYVMGYATTLLTLPGSPTRYLLPVLPFVIFYIFKGVEKICTCFPDSISPSHRFPRYLPLGKVIAVFQRPVLAKHSPVLLVCLFLLPSLFVDFFIIRNQRMTPGYHAFWKPYYQASVWMRENTPPQSRVTTRKPGLVWFWSGREADGYPRIEDPAEALRALAEYDYILLDNMPFFREKLKYVIPAIKAYPKSFKVVHVAESPKTYVIEIKKAVP